ncbi:fructose-6-phosphate aldolase [Candidatus Woesearchaeota archaeon CG10_big_fil_rev_8_21_14_0_10_37_12]|nr:MAG: fructose-6-phosphate aldolase [Candidatus Woesearchaeota archaeon CG10_big_fil_rev_8_21_14_0_10_37_12]
MQIFLDTGSVKEVERAAAFGVLDGVTTNPSLIAKEGKDFHQTIKVICKIVNGPVSAEVVNTNTEGMIKEAKQLVKLGKNVVVKIPLIPEGIKAVKQLSKQGIKVNVTLCFSPNQALLAAKAGAWCVSPFVGRLDDIGQTGIDMVHEIRQIYNNYNFKTKILFASTRSSEHVKQAALIGADICTMPYAVFEKLFHHPLTDSGLKKFLDDWNAFKKKGSHIS